MRLACLLFATLALTASTAPAQQHPAIQVLIDQQDAWNRGDIDAFMLGYKDEPQTVFISDELLRGTAEVRARYRRKYSTREQMGELKFSDLESRPLGADHALVIGRFHLTRSDQGGGDARGIFSLVFQRVDKGWKIILDHTS